MRIVGIIGAKVSSCSRLFVVRPTSWCYNCASKVQCNTWHPDDEARQGWLTHFYNIMHVVLDLVCFLPCLLFVYTLAFLVHLLIIVFN